MSTRHPAARVLGGLVTLATVSGAGAILVSFAGAWLEPFDSIAHFRLHLAVLMVPLAVLALVLRRWTGALAATLGAALGLATTLPYVLPRPPEPATGGVYTLLQMNLRYDARDPTRALRLVADLRPDVITLEEVTDAWRASFETLKDAYPYQHWCGVYRRGGSAVLSRRPFAASGVALCRIADGFSARSVEFNGRVVTVAAQHLEWPWPRTHWRQVRRLEPTLAKLPGPAIMAGDFNATPWSAAVGTVAAAAGLTPVRGIGPTFYPAPWPDLPTRLVGLPLDNVLVSPGLGVVEVRSLPPTSSDHLPVLVRFTIDAPPPEPETATAQASSRAEVNAN